ncbi:hypothetical protein TNCT_571111 [Trichonephila clavata]|uniref:Uncharacterized protein n=1 Tax=Trichonephila clavata TaxID=2740835 RepID=A0A8X6KD65_TRICU|nr:hypothetical protein TNCT_571111 [Trichonephila clavata]
METTVEVIEPESRIPKKVPDKKGKDPIKVRIPQKFIAPMQAEACIITFFRSVKADHESESPKKANFTGRNCRPKMR